MYLSSSFQQQAADTLIMVKNIETSLKRLKKSKKALQNEEMSDDDKIRTQIQLDVEAYGQEVICHCD